MLCADTVCIYTQNISFGLNALILIADSILTLKPVFCSKSISESCLFICANYQFRKWDQNQCMTYLLMSQGLNLNWTWWLQNACSPQSFYLFRILKACMQIVPDLLDYWVDYPSHWTGVFQIDYSLIIRLHGNIGNMSEEWTDTSSHLCFQKDRDSKKAKGGDSWTVVQRSLGICIMFTVLMSTLY